MFKGEFIGIFQGDRHETSSCLTAFFTSSGKTTLDAILRGQPTAFRLCQLCDFGKVVYSPP